jgi:precorrin-2 dehydrogenase/sirohydrochlorin ferrochelatase
VFVFGGGSLGLAKVQILSGVGARVTVIAERFVKGFDKLPAELRAEAFPEELEFLSGAFFVVAATNNRDLDSRISKECHRLGVLCNSVDDLASEVHFPSMVSRGPLRIAVSSGGASPGLSRMARQEIEKAIGPEWGAMADLQAAARSQLKKMCRSKEKRKQVIGQILKDQELWNLLREKRQEDALNKMRNRYLDGLA